jgi:hypothetical protein
MFVPDFLRGKAEPLYEHHPRVMHGVELGLILLLLIAPGVGVGDETPIPDLAGGFVPFVEGVEPGALVALFGLLVLTRVFRRPGLFLTVGGLGFIGYWAGLYALQTAPALRIVKASFLSQVFGIRFLIPEEVFALSDALCLLVPFLLGIYCARRGFRVWKFAAGFGLGYVIPYALLPLEVIEVVPLVAGLVYFLFTALVIVRLPLQRQVLEDLFGFPLEPGRAAPAPRRLGFGTALLGHGLLVILGATSLLLAGVFVYLGNVMRVVQEGPTRVYRSPGLVDAGSVLDPLLAGNALGRSTAALETVFPEYPLLSSSTRPETLEQMWPHVNIETVEAAFAGTAPVCDALGEAASADYWSALQAGISAPVPLRRIGDAARVLAARSVFRLHQNRREEALADIDTLLRVSRLVSEGKFVNHMIATYIRGIALNVATTDYLVHRETAERLEPLATLLRQRREDVRYSFPVDDIRRHEPTMFYSAGMAAITLPGLERAYFNFYSGWVHYDQLLLAIALERYKAARGEYPKTLEALLPEFLVQLPLEPYEGKTYRYRRVDAGFEISLPGLATVPMKERRIAGLPFNPDTIRNERLVTFPGKSSTLQPEPNGQTQ